MKGKDKGCEQEYGTYACWECPDPNAPTHLEIMEFEKPSCFGKWLSRTAVICLTCKSKNECCKICWATEKRGPEPK